MNRRTVAEIQATVEAARAAGGQLHTSTDLGDDTLTSDVYSGAAQYGLEVEKVFWRAWIPVARVTDLAEKGRWLHRSVERAEVVITRDEDGTLHAFHNTCLHRGTALVSADGCGQRLVCPYHAWSYKLDGQLASVPEPISYPKDFDPGSIRLQPVAVAEHWGFIWVNLSANPPTIEEYLGENLLDELTNYRLGEAEHKGRFEKAGPFNWKVAMEGFLEPYHVPWIHPRSVFPVVHHQFAAMKWWGDHSRMMLPLRDPDLYQPKGIFGRVAAQVGIGLPDGLNELQRTASFVYLVWPTTVFNILPNHITVFHMLPLGPDRTNVVLDVYGQPSKDAVQKDFWDKLAATYHLLVDEDAAPAAAIQRGLSGAIRPPLTMSHYDRRIRHFRKRLDVWLARGGDETRGRSLPVAPPEPVLSKGGGRIGDQVSLDRAR
jgi:phenylpropionate dioxygenase-like ring-hydroxylating dioxygenase large terminal subunit